MSNTINFLYTITLKNGRQYGFREQTSDAMLKDYRGWRGESWLKSFVNESVESAMARPDVPFNESNIKEVSFSFYYDTEDN